MRDKITEKRQKSPLGNIKLPKNSRTCAEPFNPPEKMEGYDLDPSFTMITLRLITFFYISQHPTNHEFRRRRKGIKRLS